MIRHLVLFNLKDTVTDEQVQAVIKTAQQQLTRIPGVHNLAISKAISPYTESPYAYALTMEFADGAALATYMDHPLHQEFRKVFFPVQETRVAMDFQDVEAAK